MQNRTSEQISAVYPKKLVDKRCFIPVAMYPDIAKDSGLVNLGLEINNPQDDSLKMNLFYQGIFADNVSNNSILVSLNWGFN